jgi:hypothetical protein
MVLRLVSRLVLLAALLMAQQVALSHPIAHISAAGGSAVAGTGESPKAPLLCELHDVLGTVLGALHGTPAVPAKPPRGTSVCVALQTGDAGPQRFHLHARGPPAFS